MRPEPSEYHPRYTRYLDLVPENDVSAALLRQLEETSAFLAGIPLDVHNYSYAPGKWTLREVAGHITDTERIFGFRLLTFARGDTAQQLSRADENLYVQSAEYSSRTLASVVEEFSLVRQSNIMLLRHLPAAAWDRVGVVAGTPISVRAIAYLMLGHERHHLEIVRTRYLRSS